MMSLQHRPLLIVISGPSGTGKSTLCELLIEEVDTVLYSVSCTTRSPRIGEVEGQDYHFLEPETFRAKAQRGEFLEHASVHDYRYGTLRETVYEGFGVGRDVLMDIDVQGAAQIRAYVAQAGSDDPLKHAFVDVFIAPPSLEALRCRLQTRGKDRREDIDRRMVVAEHELESGVDYQYFLVNDKLDESYKILRSIVLAEHHRAWRCEAHV